MNLKKIVDKVYATFSEWNKVRDHLMGEMRKVLKKTREAISAIHRNELDKAETSLEDAKTVLVKAKTDFSKLPLLPVVGLVHNAEGEVSEGVLLLAFRRGNVLPGPKKIGVSEMGYLLGLGDLVGELRRVTIDALRNNDFDLASRAFDCMEEIYNTLLIFDFPRALMPGIRQKTDVARRLVERTRADISTEIQRRRLLTGITELQKTLKSR